jgi:hypothetical protein
MSDLTPNQQAIKSFLQDAAGPNAHVEVGVGIFEQVEAMAICVALWGWPDWLTDTDEISESRKRLIRMCATGFVKIIASDYATCSGDKELADSFRRRVEEIKARSGME